MCDPQAENDDDAAAICELAPDHENAASFAEWFAGGQIPFTFGPEGGKDETMTLILRDGLAYLWHT